MRTGLTDDIKRMVSLTEMLERYGFRPDRSHFVCCPFHSEKTPSMRIYADDRYYCFGCGAHGDAVDLYAYMEGIPVSRAIRQLAQELGLDDRQPISMKGYADRLKAHAAKEKRAKKEAEQLQAENEMNHALYLLRKSMKEQDEDFQFALQHISRVEFICEQLSQDKDMAFAEYGGEIERWRNWSSRSRR